MLSCKARVVKPVRWAHMQNGGMLCTADFSCPLGEELWQGATGVGAAPAILARRKPRFRGASTSQAIS